MLAKIKWKRYINYFLVGIALILTLVVTSINPRALSFTSTMTQISYSIILATSLNLVVGFLGELSLGHAGFMCVGAYIGGVIVNTLYATDMPKLLATIIALLAGGFAAAVMGLLIGIPTLKLKGDYLAIVTLGFGEIVRNLFGNMLPSVFGGPSGLTVVKYGSSLCVLALI
ncbi:MAG: branched-chain amino acid ABC transporter permease, partial [Oscillospiraceae bacterium]|nr:branched-chain amino acid ABC transporter permease [Oscillospiraceae bacterium]